MLRLSMKSRPRDAFRDDTRLLRTWTGRRPLVFEPLEPRRMLATVFVDLDATGLDNGMSWANAFTDLQDALAYAIRHDEIWVAEGTYTPASDGDRSLAFNLKAGVDIYGGFDGTERARDERNWATHVTVLSGDLIGDDTNGGSNTENSYHVVYASNVANAILDGFTVTAGNADGPLLEGKGYGGGMRNSASSPTLTNVTFSGNSANWGGGMYNFNSSSPTLTNVTFSGNSAVLLGGGMLNHDSSSPTLTNVTFNGNSADSGGGNYNFDSSSPTLINVTFSSNSAESSGGSMYNSASSPTLINVTFSSNSAESSGGGMYNSASSPTLTNVTFSGNAALYGGGMGSDSSSPTLTNVTFSGNAAPYGGGMFNYRSSSPTLANVTFSGNPASVGGGMCNFASSPTLTNVSFSGNSADFGGGMYNFASSPTLTNCILWGNTAKSNPQISDNEGSISSVTYSIVEGGWTLDADPRFVRSPSAGADSTWGTEDDDYGDLHLQPDSPAIDAGTNRAAPAFDLDGRSRPRDGNGDGSAVTDMGAYECAILYVDRDATGLNNGTSWANAFADLQAALAVANTYDEIWVAEGTYTPASDGDRSLAFNLKSGVDIYGGFDGTEGARDQRDWTSHVTVLSGDLSGDDTNGGSNSENSYQVVYALDVTDAILDGFTVTAGNADGLHWPKHLGGGMYDVASSPTLTNVTFKGNSAECGGGMYNYEGSSPTLTNVSFSGNSADFGGGMYNFASSPTLTNVSFSGNAAEGGGGVCNSASSPTLTNVSFSGNAARLYGGGMANVNSSSPTLINSILWGNTAESNPQIGDYEGSISSVTYSTVEEGWTGNGNLDTDPRFVRLPSPGADGTWGTEDDDYGDLHLQPGSPAVNAGDNGAVSDDLGDLDGDGITAEPTPLDLETLPRFVGTPPTVDMGAYECQDPNEPIDLGVVDFKELSGLNLVAGNAWYQFTTAHDGVLTAIASSAAGTVEARLHTSQTLPPLTTSTGTPTSQRLDQSAVVEGETYLLSLSGDSSDVALTVANLINPEGTEVLVHGTVGADHFDFAPTGSYLVIINGVDYHFDDTQYETIVFTGGAGDDTATLTGGPDTEVARFFPGHGTFGDNGFLVTVNDVMEITAHGGGGSDEAYLYDSPGDDTFVSRRGYGKLSGHGFALETFDFMCNYGYATTQNGGSDIATMEDTPGADKFKFDWPGSGQFFGKMYGRGVYYNRAKNFEQIEAVMTEGKNTVRLFDSEGNDTFYGQKDESRMVGPGYDVTVRGYDSLVTYASTGTDIAQLEDSTDDDETRARLHKIVLWGGDDTDPTYEITARKFDEYHFEAKNGGYDRAKLHDTVLAEHVQAAGDSAILYRNDGELDLLYELVAFEWVRLYATDNCSQDTVQKHDPIDFDLVYDPAMWEELP